MRWQVLLLVAAGCALAQTAPASHIDVVKTWARKLGDELWKLSESLTNSDHIRKKYTLMNASVKKKDGKQILESALKSVSTMLTRKVNAVKCIHATAERLARDFDYTEFDVKDIEYCSAKYSLFIGEDGKDVLEDKQRSNEIPQFALNNDNYTNISVERDSHFYDINVNTNISCVHVPTNIYYLENDAAQAIMWSEGLNDIFIKNYESDPSLSWQYFGSSHGILRFYPGMPWFIEQVDTYDCRVKSWYIEAATCSKDVVVLFDVSGSMTGFKNYVARRTLRSLLKTLSNNDYVNVYTFNKDTRRVVHCFEGLVQATPENLETITDTLEPTDNGKKHKVPLEGYANLTTAYIEAFQTLKKKRADCDVSSTQGCNQLIMLITDYVPGNLSEVFEEYNREVVDNKTYIPVRVFTYLIGKEVTNVEEIQWMACNNRGYFVHIHSIEEVQQQVLKYINVIARPMILTENAVPPPTWTHANIDETRTKSWNVSDDQLKPDEDKLVTSVAIPAFDYRHNEENNDAILLGVAGTDVPIDSIAKLAQPHQLGVNGYSFIVSNNGYLLLHPLLTTTINDNLQLNYNSVDFVEVEQVDDGKSSRELGDDIKNLRQHLVNGTDGYMSDIKVLFHYDNMRRIARVKHNYFYNQLNQTPFSMGISLPDKYGDTELLLKDNPLEAKEPLSVVGINVTQYFNISFRVHPDWVYCKYHYLEGHESVNAEQEVWTFLAELSRNKIDINQSQYPEDAESKEFDYDYHCGNGTKRLGKDDYYCNEDLVKQLVFDAKLTHEYFIKWDATNAERNLATKYNVTVRFVATSSGLTRWHYIKDKDKDKNEVFNEHGIRGNHTEPVFGDKYHNAIEETWYKAAVLQHIVNKESIVVATPLPILDEIIKKKPPVLDEDGDITITSSYAIFYKDGDSETPASVVGFQFKYSAFIKAFLSITKGHSGEKDLDCENDQYDCYIIDSSGYIVLSINESSVGDFIGVKQPHVLQDFIDKSIFEHVEVFNYQALCPLSELQVPKTASAWRSTTPFSFTKNIFNWLFTEAIIFWSNIFDVFAGKIDDEDYHDHIYPGYTASTTVKPDISNETVTAKDPDVKDSFSCDHEISLFILNQSYFINRVNPVVYVDDDERECTPPYWSAYVTRTNLLLVVVKRDWFPNDDCPKPPDTKPKSTNSSKLSREPCHKLDLGNLPRRRLEGCYTYHDKERNITACGLGCSIRANIIFIISALLVAIAPRIS